MPNAIAFGDDGVMYISDSVSGSIWRAEWIGFEGWQPAEAWVTDPLLAGTGESPFPFPVGANGVAIDDGVVYVGVTEQSHIVGIPIGPEGEAGEPFVHLSPPGVAIDGIAITDDGDFIVADPPADNDLAYRRRRCADGPCRRGGRDLRAHQCLRRDGIGHADGVRRQHGPGAFR